MPFFHLQGKRQEMEREQINKAKAIKEQMQEHLIRQANRDKVRRMLSQEQHDQMHSTIKHDVALGKQVEQLMNELKASKQLLN